MKKDSDEESLIELIKKFIYNHNLDISYVLVLILMIYFLYLRCDGKIGV